eukprot:CAMPEP_0178623968 /NCGR_PEP_ID=MMETSP0698-20121128/7111_1 /TAXON_ID=265572 /ORGANISM="Extubocellulus spinifer, Strain CCMP396" /LENGTH=245 /DNA_ID=CAMNT_0020263067 /DNA_START=49 /DNA_END=783 /DNA_ORIENTATION=-
MPTVDNDTTTNQRNNSDHGSNAGDGDDDDTDANPGRHPPSRNDFFTAALVSTDLSRIETVPYGLEGFGNAKFEIGRRRRDDNEPNNEDDDEDEDPRHLYWTNPASNVYDQLYPATTNNKSTKAKATCTTHTPLRKNLLHYYLSCGLASTRATTKANANDEKENYCSSRASATAALNAILIRAASLGDTAGMSYLVDNDICGTATSSATNPNVGTAVCTAAASSGQLEALIYAREVFGYPWDVRRA